MRRAPEGTRADETDCSSALKTPISTSPDDVGYSRSGSRSAEE